jgi:hypothetical protein
MPTQTPGLNNLSAAALSAAMRGGTGEWGQSAAAIEHVRYAEPVTGRGRRKCHCGCGRSASHRGMANGICLTTGCELSIRRWVKDPLADLRRAHTKRDARVDIPWNKLDDDGKWVKLNYRVRERWDIPATWVLWLLARCEAPADGTP